MECTGNQKCFKWDDGAGEWFYFLLSLLGCTGPLPSLFISPAFPRIPWSVSEQQTWWVRSRGPMDFLVIGFWCLGKGWAHTWAFPRKAWLLPAYFHVNKDIHCFLISVVLGIIQLQLAVRLSITGEGRRQRVLLCAGGRALPEWPVLLFKINISVSAGPVGQPQALSLIAGRWVRWIITVDLIKTSYVGSISTARGGGAAAWPTLICLQSSRGPTSTASLSLRCISSRCLRVRWGVISVGARKNWSTKGVLSPWGKTVTAQLV